MSTRTAIGASPEMEVISTRTAIDAAPKVKEIHTVKEGSTMMAAGTLPKEVAYSSGRVGETESLSVYYGINGKLLKTDLSSKR